MKDDELSSLPLIKPDGLEELAVFEPMKMEKEVKRLPEVTRVPVFEPIKTSEFSSLPDVSPVPATSSPFHFSSIPEIPRSNTGSIFDSQQENEELRRVPQKAQIPVFETNNEVESEEHPFSETLFPTHNNRDKSELNAFTTPTPFVSSLGAKGTSAPSSEGESAKLIVSALPKFNYKTSPGPHVASLSPSPYGPPAGPTYHPYHPAPIHPDPHHGYGVPEPVHHDPHYGAPEPVHPTPGYGVPHLPAHPTPGYGVPEPVHHPTPGYGVPEPVYHPTPGYGVPEPVHHPDPAYGVPATHPVDSGYGIPEPVHHPTPGYGVPEPVHHPTPGYGVPEPVHHPTPGYGVPEPGKWVLNQIKVQ